MENSLIIRPLQHQDLESAAEVHRLELNLITRTSPATQQTVEYSTCSDSKLIRLIL